MTTALTKQEIVNESSAWVERAKAVTVTDRTSYVQAGNLLTAVKHFRGQLADWFAPFIDAAMDTKRKAEAARKGLVDEKERMEAPLVEAETALKRGLLAWDSQQEQVRREEEARLQAEAQQQAEALTLAAAADMEREAVASGDAAMLEEARSLLEQPVEAPVVVLETLTPRVDGLTFRDQWKAGAAINIKQLAAAVAAGTVPVTFLEPNLTHINAYIRACKGGCEIPGVQVVNERMVVARRTV